MPPLNSQSIFEYNLTLHNDLFTPTVPYVAKTLYKRFHSKLSNYRNPLITNLSIPNISSNPKRRLKRNWCRGPFKRLKQITT